MIVAVVAVYKHIKREMVVLKTKKITLTGKLVIFGLILLVVLGGTYFAGGFSALKDMATSEPTEKVEKSEKGSLFGGKKSSKAKATNEINISIDEWIGWATVVNANGGLTTQKGSIYDKLGIKVNISVINDATQSSNALIKGKIDGAGYTVNRYAFLYPKFQENKVEV